MFCSCNSGETERERESEENHPEFRKQQIQGVKRGRTTQTIKYFLPLLVVGCTAACGLLPIKDKYEKTKNYEKENPNKTRIISRKDGLPKSQNTDNIQYIL